MREACKCSIHSVKWGSSKSTQKWVLLFLQIALTNLKFCDIISKSVGVYYTMTRTTEEEFLYALMGKMYELRVPIVFRVLWF